MDPFDPVASPSAGMTPTVAGPESTLTIGNSTDNAFADRNGDNLPDGGSQPDGGAGLHVRSPRST
ncbi:MAG: hypothetical protein R2710_27950 [Acidimicrobiales bacterium]